MTLARLETGNDTLTTAVAGLIIVDTAKFGTRITQLGTTRLHPLTERIP